MKRGAAIATATLVLVACGSNQPQPPVAAPPPAAVAVPDPRIAEMQILLNELMDRLEVMTARLAALESGAGQPVQQPARPSGRAAARPATPDGATPPSATRRAAAPARPASAVVGDKYREAIGLYGRGRLDDARTAFEQIFALDPGSDLADNALFWVGETHFAQARYEQAIEVYRRIVAEYSGENKAPDALLKIGMAQARLGDLAMARATFESLLERYPYSTAAGTARHEIERVRY